MQYYLLKLVSLLLPCVFVVYKWYLVMLISVMDVFNKNSYQKSIRLVDVIRLTSSSLVFDKLVCVYGNGEFINHLNRICPSGCERWQVIRREMVNSKSLFDKYGKVLMSPSGYLDILDDLLLKHPQNKRLEQLKDLDHPTYRAISKSQSELGLTMKQCIDLRPINDVLFK